MTETHTGVAGAAAGAATKRWWFTKMPASEMLAFLNGNPAQGPGEFSATTLPDGTVELYFYSAVGPRP